MAGARFFAQELYTKWSTCDALTRFDQAALLDSTDCWHFFVDGKNSVPLRGQGEKERGTGSVNFQSLLIYKYYAV